MNIIYVSSGCSEDKFEDLRKKGITKKLPQAQKYHQLMVEGLAEVIDGTVYVISAIPTNRSWSKRLFFDREVETIGNIQYRYIPFINFPLIGQLSRIFFAGKEIRRLLDGSRTYIICDVLNQSVSEAAKKAGKRNGIPVLGIVTDVPGHTSGASRKEYSFFRRLLGDFAEYRASKIIHSYDSYLFLTEAMNNVVNLNNRPYMVAEGQCDHKMKDAGTVKKSFPRVAMYAGGIHKEYGIEMMVEAFLKEDRDGWELHIYGDGNYREELTELSEVNSKIKYFGVVSNAEITQRQLEASLLLNPRPTDAEYVKYSFPSKTMECMVSGTPLLTTRLPGMPEEYYSHVYFFDDESVEGMAEAFSRVLALPDNELSEKGRQAKEFVLKEKNNISQARKVISFLDNL